MLAQLLELIGLIGLLGFTAFMGLIDTLMDHRAHGYTNACHP